MLSGTLEVEVEVSKYRRVAVSADELEAAESYAGTVEEHARYCSLLYAVARADIFSCVEASRFRGVVGMRKR